jgi:cobalamin biosynthesis protein CobT
MRDIVEYCDGFMPITGRYDIAGQINQIKEMAEEAGRDPESIEFGQFGTPPKEEIVESLVEAGLTRIVFGLPPAPAEKVLPILDSHAEFAAKFNA